MKEEQEVGWIELKPGTVLQEGDCWDYKRNKKVSRSTLHDITSEYIGKVVDEDDTISWFRFQYAG